MKKMNKFNTVAIVLSLAIQWNSKSQTLTQVAKLRLYEHHSSSINGNANFGDEANGSKSAYDFVKRDYISSFDPNSFDAYVSGEEAGIDMVEHNGPFGSGSNFGFTSGTSSIWQGRIKGNNVTLWMQAPSNFDYYKTNTVEELQKIFDPSKAGKSIDKVELGKSYIGKIRNSNLYVVVYCLEVQNGQPTGGRLDVYFEFEYKYGTATTAVNNLVNKTDFKMFPNPTNGIVNISALHKNIDKIEICDVTGQILKAYSKNEITNTLDLSELKNQLYIIKVFDNLGTYQLYKIAKQ